MHSSHDPDKTTKLSDKPEKIEIPTNKHLQHDITHTQSTYHHHKPGRDQSSLELRNNNQSETYLPVKYLGAGGHGYVRLFACATKPEKAVAVKQMLPNETYEDQPHTIEGIIKYIDKINREIHHLALAYPALTPYLVKHFITDDDRYHYRLIMPYFSGKSFLDFALTEIHTTAQFALLALKIAEELKRIHDLGFFHGDLRSGNILCATSIESEFGMNSFDIHLIDFDHAGLTQTQRTKDCDESMYSVESFFFNESLDIVYLQLWLGKAVKKLTDSNRNIKNEIDIHFPELARFIQEQHVAETFPEVTRLKEFIPSLKLDLRNWEINQQKTFTDSRNRYTLHQPQPTQPPEPDKPSDEKDSKACCNIL